MYNPSHPGIVIYHVCLKPLKLSLIEASELLNLDGSTIYAISHGEAPVTPEIALNLQTAGFGSTTSWLTHQRNYDKWKADNYEEWKQLNE